MAAYRKRWLGKILDLYSGSRTRIVFLALPRGPAPRPDASPQVESHSVREFGRRSGVILLPERAFESVEYPEFYFDGLHLNSRGRERFSALLAKLIIKTLTPN